MSCELSLCSALRVERSAAPDPVHPSAATTNAALAGDLDDVPLGTAEEAAALLQTRFHIVDEQPPKTNDPHGQHPKNERIHLCILCALCGFKTDDFPSGRNSSAAARAPASADEEWITQDFFQVKHKPGKFDVPPHLVIDHGRGCRPRPKSAFTHFYWCSVFSVSSVVTSGSADA
jgi:hypothetical protein